MQEKLENNFFELCVSFPVISKMSVWIFLSSLESAFIFENSQVRKTTKERNPTAWPKMELNPFHTVI